MNVGFAGKLTRREFAGALELAGEPLEVSNLHVSSRLLSARVIAPAAALAIASLAAVVRIGYQVAATGVSKALEIVWMISCLLSLGILASALAITDAFLRQWKCRKSLRTPIVGTITHEGIELESPSGQELNSWSSFREYRERQKLVIVVYRTGQWLPLSRRFFASEADWETFRVTISRELPAVQRADKETEPTWQWGSSVGAVVVLAVLVILGIGVILGVGQILVPGFHGTWQQLGQTLPELFLAGAMTVIGAVGALLAAGPALLASLWPTLIHCRFVDPIQGERLIERRQEVKQWTKQFLAEGFVPLGVRVERPLWGFGNWELAFTSKLAEAYGDITVNRFGMLQQIVNLYTPFSDGGIVLTTTWPHIKPSEGAGESVSVVTLCCLEHLLETHSERVQAFKKRGRVPTVGVTAESRLAAARQYHASAVGRRSMRWYGIRAAGYAALFAIMTAFIIAAGHALRGTKPWYERLTDFAS
jgi:hypothetical protein